MKLIKRFQQGGSTANIDMLFKGLSGLTQQAGLQQAKLASGILASSTPQKNDFVKNESFVDPNAPVNYLTPAMQEGGIMDKANYFIKSLFRTPIRIPEHVQKPQPRNTYKIREPLEPNEKSYPNPDKNFFAGPKITDTRDTGFIKTPEQPIQQADSAFFKTPKLITKSYGGGDKLPTAPKAEVRYANSQRLYNEDPYFRYSTKYQNGENTGVVQNTPYSTIPAIITQQIIGNDTIYRETPDQKRFRLRGFPVTRTASSTDDNKQEYRTMQNRFNTAWGIAKHQDGGEFKENLEPPSRDFFDQMGENIRQGHDIMGRIVSSPAVQILTTGIAAGTGGMFGPTMKISKTAKELVINPRNAIRKFARNLNAKKGDPTYRWTKTSGDIRHGGAIDYQYPGMGSRARMKVNSAGRSEGSRYSAQSQLNTNPTYQKASSPVQTPMQRTWNNQRAEPVEWQASRRVMQRNNLIDQARDWRNYIFESPKYGWANFKLIPKNQTGTTKGGIQPVDNTRVQKPIPGVIPVNSEVRTYDNIPVRVSKHYPYQDKYYLGNPARPMYSPWKNIKLNGIYPSAYGVELDVLPPELIQKIDGNDTTYYVQGDNREYYPVAGQQSRPAFREAFKNPKTMGNRPNYFDTPEKIDKVKQVIANWQK